MKTTPLHSARLIAASTLLLFPALLHADLLKSARLTPLASDYLLPPDDEPILAKPVAEADSSVTQLPPVVVSSQPLADISADETLTPEGRAFFAKQHYFTGATDTLNRFTLPLFGQNRQTVALERLREDERLSLLASIDTSITTISSNDPVAAAELRDLRNAAFIRKTTF